MPNIFPQRPPTSCESNVCNVPMPRPVITTLNPEETQEKLGKIPPELHMLLGRIRGLVYRYKLPITQYFEKADVARTGFISTQKFILALRQCFQMPAALSETDIKTIACYFSYPGDQVCYDTFCNWMTDIPNIKALEFKSNKDLPGMKCRYSKAWLDVPNQTKSEDTKSDEIIRKAALAVNRKKLLILPSSEFGFPQSSGVLNVRHFRRALEFLDIHLPQYDIDILAKRFSTQNYAVDFGQFVRELDFAYKAYWCKEEGLGNPFVELDKAMAVQRKHKIAIDARYVLEKVRQFVYTQRINLKSFFVDCDPLRSGLMTKNQFRRCMTKVGTDRLGRLSLTEDEIAELMTIYQHPSKKDTVFWRSFVIDVESTFAVHELEKQPQLFPIRPEATINLPPEGTVDWENIWDKDLKNSGDFGMGILKQKLMNQRLEVWETFRDEDHFNNGRVPVTRFYGCLARHNVSLEPHELEAIIYKYKDKKGLNYHRLLNELYEYKHEPEYYSGYKDMQVRMKKSRNIYRPEMDETNIEDIFLRIKTKLYRERYYMMQYFQDMDPLNHGRILKVNFRRALDNSSIKLRQREMDVIEGCFQAPGYPEYVDYRAFEEEIQSIFTLRELEKNPLMTPVPYVPPDDSDWNYLTPAENEYFVKSMRRLAKFVEIRGLQLNQMFRKFDRNHIGLVSRNQFHRVLSMWSVQFTPMDLDLICKRFQVIKGLRKDVDYLGFVAMLDSVLYMDYKNTPYDPDYLKPKPIQRIRRRLEREINYQ